MVKLLDRYILREVVPPFLVGLLLVTFVLLMNQVLLLADLFIDKGVPWPQALRLLGLLVPSILVFALPMAVLMGVLGGLARLAADSEIVALRSAGVGPRRLARPLFVFGFCGFLLTLPLALFLAPRANDAWVRSMTHSVLARVRLKIEPLEFNETLPGTVLLVRGVGPDDAWRDVFAYLGQDPSRPRVVLAKAGTVRLFPERRRAVLDLRDGRIYGGRLDSPGEDSVTAFDRLEEEIDVTGLFPSISNAKRVREKDIGELVRDLRALEASRVPGEPEPRQVRAHRIEIHKKLALPAACLVLALLGLPLGIMTGRAGRTGGFSLGLGIIVVYYAMLTMGEKAAMDGRLSAALGMWGPDIILTSVAAFLLLGAGGILRSTRRKLRGHGVTTARKVPEAPMTPPGSSASRGPARPPSRHVRFPGLLDRYVSRKFLALLALALAALTVAAFLVTFFEGLDDALQHGRPVGLVLSYAWFKLPELQAFLLPAAVLAAALLALGFLARTNEATALKASGISAYRIVLPVLALSAALSGLAFLIQERVVPAAHARAEAAWNVLAGLPARSSPGLNRHWVLAGRGDRIYHYDYLDLGTSTLGRFSVFDIDTRNWTLARRTFASRASFEGDQLAYKDGWIRDYAASSGPAFALAAAGRLDVSSDASDIRAPRTSPMAMTYGQLRRYAAEVRAMGFATGRLRAELGQKTAMPFVSLVMALLAVPFGFRMGRKGTLVGVGISVVIAMAYWGTFAVFRSLGAAGALPPALGAWGANALFGLAGVIGLLRLRT
jgi:LPS export ABC transporter permease LptF/LPS export ABC transporter permease LptG